MSPELPKENSPHNELWRKSWQKTKWVLKKYNTVASWLEKDSTLYGILRYEEVFLSPHKCPKICNLGNTCVHTLCWPVVPSYTRPHFFLNARSRRSQAYAKFHSKLRLLGAVICRISTGATSQKSYHIKQFRHVQICLCECNRMNANANDNWKQK